VLEMDTVEAGSIPAAVAGAVAAAMG